LPPQCSAFRFVVARLMGMPVDHVKLPVSDLDATRAFYAAALCAFGYQVVWDRGPTLGFGTGDGGDDNEPIAFERMATPIARCHVALTAASREIVDRFHAAALAAGGTDNGGPGERPYGATYYAAFVLDPDRHNLEAVYKGGSPTTG
jgi:catechol 2,3-dioxygenase-like lactoylglutathione lyase family enzyme